MRVSTRRWAPEHQKQAVAHRHLAPIRAGYSRAFLPSSRLSHAFRLGSRGEPVAAEWLARFWPRVVAPSRSGATSAYASRSLPAEAEDATAADGISRASSDAALPGSIGASMSCAAREGGTGPCPFTREVLVSWSLLFMGGVLLRFARVTPRVRRSFWREKERRLAGAFFSRSGEFLIVLRDVAVRARQIGAR